MPPNTVTRDDIPVCVDIIRKSFKTVADEFGFTIDNAPRFTAFATTEERLYLQMDNEPRPRYASLCQALPFGPIR